MLWGRAFLWRKYCIVEPYLIFSQIKGQLNGSNVWLQTMKCNNRMVRCLRSQAASTRTSTWDVLWLMISRTVALVAQETSDLLLLQAICRGSEGCYCWPSPTIYFLFFMVVCLLLPIQYQLCLETFQLVLYRYPHKTMTVGQRSL